MISVHAREPRAFDIVEATAELLEQASQKSPSSWTARGDAAAFDALYLPSLSIRDYSLRLRKYCYCSNECHVLALIYVDRILECNADFMVTQLNAHRLLLAATVIAAKFQDDDIYNNRYYAKVGGVSHEELHTLEAKFLNMIGWKTHVPEAEYYHCFNCLLNNSADVQRADISVGAIPPQADPETPVQMASSSLPTPAQKCSRSPGDVLPATSKVTVQDVLERVLPTSTKNRETLRRQPSRQKHREARGRTCYGRPRTRFNERRFRTCPAAHRGTAP